MGIHYKGMWAVCCKKQENYNCFSKEAWTEEKREWGCKEQQLGCKEDDNMEQLDRYICLSREAWTEEKRGWCCKEHQLGCKEGEKTRMVMHEDGSTNVSTNSTVNDFVSSALPYDCALAFLFALMSCSFPHREAGS